jgi:hypothetical protein
MRPQPPPFSPISPPSLACTERLGRLVDAASELAIEIGLGGSLVADRMVAELLAELRPAVPDLARERARGRATTRVMLDNLADKLEAAADHRVALPRFPGDCPAPLNLAQLRALIARMRLLAYN